MIRKELQRENMRSRAGRSAWLFEKRLEEGKGSGLARECKKEMREKGKVGRVGELWKKERRIFFKERRLSVEELEKRR